MSCKKFIQVGYPTTKLVTASVFNNSTTATAALLSIYAQMANNAESFNLSQASGLLSDELDNYSTDPIQIKYYTDAMAASDNPGHWGNFYNYIYQANAIIEGVQNNAYIASAIESQLVGESKFIRAFWLFYLANMYGDVPLATSTDYKVNNVLTKAPKSQVYMQIVSDLHDAQQLLDSNYVDASDTSISNERVRPTKAVATALLARVYLFLGKYDSAEYEATQVINNNSLYQLCTNLSGPNSVFLANSTEAIWQLSTPIPATFNTFDGQAYILKSAPRAGDNNSTTISPQLLNSFETGDLRKSNWIGVYQKVGTSVVYYFPYKYQSYGAAVASEGDATEYVMVFRLAEQLLIRAEARLQQGEIGDAVNDLNLIRQRAGLGVYAGATDQASLLGAVLHERRVELFTEWGHRWFDMIRTGTVDSIMGQPGGVCQSKGGAWISTSVLYPIPQTEIIADPNLTQNAGY